MSGSFWREQRFRLLAALALMAVLATSLYWGGALSNKQSGVQSGEKPCCREQPAAEKAPAQDKATPKQDQTRKPEQPDNKKADGKAQTRTESWTVPSADKDGKIRNRVIALK